MESFEKKRIWLALLPTIVFIAIVWIVFVVGYAHLFGCELSTLGILPREGRGLIGIIFSPLLHTSFSHLMSNTLPLLVLVWFLFYFYSKISFQALAYLWILSGLFTWIIGRSSYHLGASGLVFALLFFLFFSGLVRKYIPLVAVSLVVAFIYGSTVWSIFPITEWVDSSISWEGHLSGAIAGIILAIVFRNEGPQKPVKVWAEELDDYDEDDDVL